MSFISDFISGFKEYVTQTWKNRPSTETPMSAERLNHIEAGIKSISDAIKSMASAIMKDMDDLTIGASDWNATEGEPGYVQNRTHWVEYVSKAEVIVEETSVSFSSNMGSLYGLGTDTVIEGKPYVVNWNGTVYECTAFSANQSIFLGNAALASLGDDSGEPFCMEMLSATSAFVVKSNKDAETIKIKVEIPEVVKYHTIDPNFIPPGSGGGGVSSWNDLTDKPFYVEREEVEILSGVHFANGVTDAALEPTRPIVSGETYAVKMNDTTHICVAREHDGIIYLGNQKDIHGVDTGEPFCIKVSDGVTNFTWLSSNRNEFTLSIYIAEKIKGIEDQFTDYFVCNVIFDENGKKVLERPFSDLMNAYCDGKLCVLMYGNYPYFPSLQNYWDNGLMKQMSFARYEIDYQKNALRKYEIEISDGSQFVQTYSYDYFYFHKNADYELDDSSSNAVQNKVIAEKFAEVYSDIEKNVNSVVTLSTKVDSLFESSGGGSVLAVVKDESKFFEGVGGLPMYKCSDSAPTYEEMCNGVIITLSSDQGSITMDISSDYIAAEDQISFALIGDEIPIVMSIPYTMTMEGEDGEITIEKGFYVLIDYSAITGEGNHVVSAVEINGYSFGGGTKIKEEYLPESLENIVLQSSTAGSTKKFKITVNDSGAITATEVTE